MKINNLNLKEGKFLIKLARQSIKTQLGGKKLIITEKKIPEKFKQKRGMFVTIETYPQKELRGCIGFILPTLNLYETVIQAAKAAAFSDFRFRPLTKQEYDNVIIEISVLTEPQLIQEMPQDIPRSIKIGTDGLVIQFAGFSGLLLPQVAPEQKWDALEFLRGTCIKAGLPAEAWLNPACKVYKFQAQIFSEEKPKGRVVEKRIKAIKT